MKGAYIKPYKGIQSQLSKVNQKLNACIRVALFMADSNKKVLYLSSLLKGSSIIIPYPHIVN